jgi:tetratricopeptide (TPR) repeat protein
MMKPRGFLALLSLATSSCLALAGPADDLIKKGDRLDAQFKSAEAMAVFLEADKLDPNNLDILCRLAKTHDESMVDTASKEEQKRLAQAALEYAQRAVTLNPKSAKAQLSMAITCGRLAPYLDSKAKIAHSKLVKEHAEKALELEPSNSYAHHIIGAWNYEMASISPFLRAVVKLIYGSLPAASFEQAEVFFQKAVSLSPNKVSHRIELGRTYAALNKKDLAREEITKGLSLPNKEKDDPDTKLRGKDTLAKL